MKGAAEFISSCDYCGGKDASVIIQKAVDNDLLLPGEFNIVKCTACGLVYLNPRPDKNRIGEYYPVQYSAYRKESRIFAFLKSFSWAREAREVKTMTGGKGSMLDIGCGQGELLDFLKKGSPGYECFGIEMDCGSAEKAKTRFGIEAWCGRFEDFSFPPQQKFDFIIMHYVLEHLPSPKAAFEKLRSMTVPGGHVLISVPNHESWERKIFGRYWQGYEVPLHFYSFTARTLTNYAEDAGFSVRKIKYSIVPNDWIWGIHRLLKEKGYMAPAAFFQPRNVLLLMLFLPVSIAGWLCGASSRFTIILKVRGNGSANLRNN